MEVDMDLNTDELPFGRLHQVQESDRRAEMPTITGNGGIAEDYLPARAPLPAAIV
jgi:hypothetical protein